MKRRAARGCTAWAASACLALCATTLFARDDAPQVAALTLEIVNPGALRTDCIVGDVVDAARLAALAGRGATFDASDFEAREVDATGAVIAAGLPLQIASATPADPVPPGAARVLIRLPGALAPDAVRRVEVVRRTGGNPPAPEVVVDPAARDAAAETLVITTPRATYRYDSRGAAFSGLLDVDGLDWISYRPGDGPRGAFRGVPNNGHPQGYMHPGGDLSATTVLEDGPVRVVLYSESKDGLWAGQWEIHPDGAVFTQLRAHTPYWFLYEGTPGGAVEVGNDFWIRADGSTGAINEGWRDHRMEADWVAFADRAVGRSILLVHEVNQSEDNQYWLMERAMTVFGFGRHRMEKRLDAVPRRFLVALVDSVEHGVLADRAAAFLTPVRVAHAWR